MYFVFENGIISAYIYEKWRRRMIEKYAPPIDGIVSNRIG